MLVQLTIKDFAIIDALSVSFSEGSNILSGETGAGKSIIINAVNLILGGRASPDLIRTGADRAVVEALFQVPEKSPLSGLFVEMGIPCSDEVLIKRTVSREGKSRVRINGSLATLHMLSQLGLHLISVSGQNEHQLLLKPENHLFILDDFGDLTPDRIRLNGFYKDYCALKEEVKELANHLREAEERREFTLFQINEIEGAQLSQGEDGDREAEKKRLVHAESLMDIVFRTYQTLYEKDEAVLSILSLLARDMDRGVDLDPNLKCFREQLVSAQLQLEDLCLELRDFYAKLKVDPGRLEEVEERLQLIRRLKKKYAPSIAGILAFKEELSQQEYQLSQKKDELRESEIRLEEKKEDLLKRATELSSRRHEIARVLEAKVEQELHQLGMAGTIFKIEFGSDRSGNSSLSVNSIDSTIAPDGVDDVEFMISPNVGEDLRPLTKIASGGELSRIMLALKTILARTGSVETLVFDEIDAGIGGATAAIIGEKLRSLAKYHQIVCITHLPQIASAGGKHFLVEKKVSKGRTRTLITSLGKEKRVDEIARLLGGKVISEKTIAHAREMLSYQP